jgi:hypothetical protein
MQDEMHVRDRVREARRGLSLAAIPIRSVKPLSDRIGSVAVAIHFSNG